MAPNLNLVNSSSSSHWPSRSPGPLTKKSTPQSASRPRVIWAVDLSGSAARFSKSIPRILHYFARKAGAVIEPTFVLKMLPEIYGDFTLRWLPEYCQAAEDRLELLIENLGLERITAPRVIFHDSLSTSGAVKALSDRAAQSRADLIIAQTHSREGVRRLFMGSFAETLLFQSPVPVMLISREMKPFHGFGSILFPTDFGPSARVRFNGVLEFARKFGSRVTLFHSVQHPVDESVVEGALQGGEDAILREYIQNKIGSAKRKAAYWAQLAKERGTAMDFVIDEKGLSVADEILRIAKKRNSGLIAMEAQSRPVSAALIGSYTRQVVRHAPCPVLVLKPRAAHALRVVPRPAAEEQTRRAA